MKDTAVRTTQVLLGVAVRRQIPWEGPVSSGPFSSKEEHSTEGSLDPGAHGSESTSSTVPGTEEVPRTYLLNE